MPRVNRDLQRRMAARRERERRRPTERRYQFAPTGEPSVEPEEAFGDGAPLAEETLADVEANGGPMTEAPPPDRASRTLTRSGRGAVARPAPKPFSEYRDEYRYVLSDLRRILLVIGSLLLVLIILSLVLPH
jgi:hypothetical protein